MKRLLGAAAIAFAGAAVAAEGPRAIELGEGVSGRVGKGEADCYQIDAPKGATLSVGVKPQGFAPNVQILRGARCDADVPTFETDGTADGGADLPFKSVGGRYLVVVRAKSGGGAYTLKVSGSEAVAAKEPAKAEGGAPAPKGEAVPADLAAMITAGLSKEDADKLVGGVAPAPEDPKVDPKVALMRKQLAVYKDEQEKERLRREEEARRAEEERIRQQEEEEIRRENERQARAEREANNQAMWGAILQGVQQVAGAYVEAKQERYQAQARLNELARQRDEANARKAAEAQEKVRAAQEAQQQQTRQAFAQRLGQANAIRDAELAKTTDPARRAQLQKWNAEAEQIAKQYGAEGAFQQARGSSGGSGGLTVTAGNQQQQQAYVSPAQQAQQRAAAEAKQRDKDNQDAAEFARKRNEAIAKDKADREKMLEDQRKAREAAQKAQQEMQRKMQAQMMLNQHASGGMSTVGLGPTPKGGTPPGSGEMSKGVSNIGACKATNVTARYSLGILMGDATVNGTWRWEGDPQCSPPHNTAVWFKVQNGTAYGWVKAAPPVPDAGKGTFNVAESPSWSQLLCSFSGSGPRGCMSEAQAKTLWVTGQVTDFVIAW